MNVQAAVETKNLTRTFGPKRVVDRVSLSVGEGEIYGYLGLNGAGKSTTIKMLTTLLPPTAGQARVLGYDIVRDARKLRKVIGLVGDEGGADARPQWNAREYLRYFARLHGVRAPRREVEDVLDFMGLEPEARRRRISTYSTGMKVRVEVARALLGRPKVLFLDEPTRGLDLPGKREMWTFFKELAAKEKVTIFVSSHEVNEIQALCRRLSVIAKGRLTYRGDAAKLGTDAATFETNLIKLLKTTGDAPGGGGGFQWSR